MTGFHFAALAAYLLATVSVHGLDREETEFRVYQFSPNETPRIDGDASDWEHVPDSYIVGTSELWDDSGQNEGIYPETPLEIRVRVARVDFGDRIVDTVNVRGGELGESAASRAGTRFWTMKTDFYSIAGSSTKASSWDLGHKHQYILYRIENSSQTLLPLPPPEPNHIPSYDIFSRIVLA